VISSTCKVQIIGNYKEHPQLLWAVDELYVPAWVGPDELGVVVDDIDTILDEYYSIT